MASPIRSTRTFTRCGHPDDQVVADILDSAYDGLVDGFGVQWCRVCGAYRRTRSAEPVEEWRVPEGSDGRGVRF